MACYIGRLAVGLPCGRRKRPMGALRWSACPADDAGPPEMVDEPNSIT